MGVDCGADIRRGNKNKRLVPSSIGFRKYPNLHNTHLVHPRRGKFSLGEVKGCGANLRREDRLYDIRFVVGVRSVCV